MKKKVSLFMLCGIVLLGVCGCDNNNNNKSNEQNTNKNIKDVLSQDYHYWNTIKCEALNEDIVGLSYGMIVTKNKVYELNMDKFFSNEQNCKEIEYLNLDSEIIALGSSTIYTINKEYVKNGSTGKFSLFDNTLYQDFLSSLGNIIIYSPQSAIGGFSMVSIDNYIKLYKSYSVDGNKKIKYIEIENQLPSNEYVKNIDGAIVKTNRAYYQLKRYKTNKEQCEKYADVKCQYSYKLEENKTLTENYNNIKYANDSLIIDKSNNVYISM